MDACGWIQRTLGVRGGEPEWIGVKGRAVVGRVEAPWHDLGGAFRYFIEEHTRE